MQPRKQEDTLHELTHFEASIDAEKRKLLGQFFTNARIGKLLAHLALDESTDTVIDCMAGSGNLLAETLVAAGERKIILSRVDGIEIDPATAEVCKQRLACLTSGMHTNSNIIQGSAFAQATRGCLDLASYGLVITNPPFVRYQLIPDSTSIRDHLRVAASQSAHNTRDIFSELIDGYSGLADLSIPSWLLAAMLVRPGGRIAIVVPSTWRSRSYADVVRYMLLRLFEVETVVEDTQPGWFSDALVRTQLVVARRFHDAEGTTELSSRRKWASPNWLTIAPIAQSESSSVGNAFDGQFPELEMSTWIRSKRETQPTGIKVKAFSLDHEWKEVRQRANSKRWMKALERGVSNKTGNEAASLPAIVHDIAGSYVHDLVSLERLGISVGQGLRTGCNRFFYVTLAGETASNSDLVRVTTSSLFQSKSIRVPRDILHPAIKNQKEAAAISAGALPDTYVMDLNGWYLPESASTRIHDNRQIKIMPEELADFIRLAAQVELDDSGKGIADLSAVKPNIRKATDRGFGERHWYMLPNFQIRHRPLAFVPRVNQVTPWVEANRDPRLIIDANFSTFWSSGGPWDGQSVKAIFNSVWCRTCMEALGTPMGGGALKLEANQLRMLPLPNLNKQSIQQLSELGTKLTRENSSVMKAIDRIIFEAIFPEQLIEEKATEFEAKVTELLLSRQRKAS